jgi:hypothetical protein
MKGCNWSRELGSAVVVVDPAGAGTEELAGGRAGVVVVDVEADPHDAPAAISANAAIVAVDLRMPVPSGTGRRCLRTSCDRAVRAGRGRSPGRISPDRVPVAIRRQPRHTAEGDYRWLKPPDSSGVIATLTGCLSKWAMASPMSLSSRNPRSRLTPWRTRMRWTEMSANAPVSG